jgi:hypothetical protein
MRFLQQREPLHGQHLLESKVLLPIGLWVAAVAVQGRMTNEVEEAEVEVLLQQAHMR